MSNISEEIILEDVWGFIEEFNNESDRAAVILAAAEIDDLLRQILVKVLRPSTQQNDQLFDTDMPLSSFSARIKLADRLGIIDEEIFSALNLLRKVRNDFAHKRGMSLTSGKTNDQIKSLLTIFKRSEHFSSKPELKKAISQKNISHAFKGLIAYLVVKLQVVKEFIKPLHLKQPKIYTKDTDVELLT